MPVSWGQECVFLSNGVQFPLLSFRAKSRNLADSCTRFSVRSRIPPLRDAAHPFGRNDSVQTVGWATCLPMLLLPTVSSRPLYSIVFLLPFHSMLHAIAMLLTGYYTMRLFLLQVKYRNRSNIPSILPAASGSNVRCRESFGHTLPGDSEFQQAFLACQKLFALAAQGKAVICYLISEVPPGERVFRQMIRELIRQLASLCQHKPHTCYLRRTGSLYYLLVREVARVTST